MKYLHRKKNQMDSFFTQFTVWQKLLWKFLLNLFLVNGPILYPLKTLNTKKKSFSSVFRGFEMRTLARNRLISYFKTHRVLRKRFGFKNFFDKSAGNEVAMKIIIWNTNPILFPLNLAPVSAHLFIISLIRNYCCLFW